MDLSIENLKGQYVEEKNSFWDFKGKYDFVDKWYLMETPLPVMIITGLYLAFVLKIVPDFMKSRKPYQLTMWLTFYNGVQVMLSLFLFQFALKLTIQEGLFQKKCMSNPESIDQLTTGFYYYLVCKLSELLDTIFFVLRKKQNQVTFLHVYHHSFAVWITWLLLKYDPSFIALFIGLLNSFVHVVMYLYYGLSAFPNLTKYLWWKKYITKLQLIQFFLVLVHIIINEATSECKTSTITLTAIYGNLLLFIYLFLKFYIQAYSVKSKRQNIEREVSEMKLKENKNASRTSNNGDVSKSSTNGKSGMNVNFSIGNKPIKENGKNNKRKLL